MHFDGLEMLLSLSPVATHLLSFTFNKGKERVYNVGSNKSISVGQIAKLIKKYTGCKIVFKKNVKVKNEPITNINKIKKEFNFSPKKLFENEIKMIIKNYKNEYN